MLFLFFFVSYFIFNYSEKKSETIFNELSRKLQKTPQERELEKKLESYRDKINYYNIILSTHRWPTKIFNLLEKITHPHVWFSKFDLDLEKRILILGGEAENFYILGQQILLLEKESVITSVSLAEIAIEEKIKFSLKLTLKEEIFK